MSCKEHHHLFLRLSPLILTRRHNLGLQDHPLDLLEARLFFKTLLGAAPAAALAEEEVTPIDLKLAIGFTVAIGIAAFSTLPEPESSKHGGEH